MLGAITMFVIGLLSLLTSLDIISTSLKVGTTGSACMAGAGIVVLGYLYAYICINRNKVAFKPQKGNVSGSGGTDHRGGVVHYQYSLEQSLEGRNVEDYRYKYEKLEAEARRLGVTDVEARLRENFGVSIPEITLDDTSIDNQNTANYSKSLYFLLSKQDEFLNLSLTTFGFGDDTSLAYHTVINALCFRFHSCQKPNRNVSLNRLTLGDIPHLTGKQIYSLLKNGKFPLLTLFCLSKDQLRAIDECGDSALQEIVAKSLFQFSIGHYANQYMKEMYQSLPDSSPMRKWVQEQDRKDGSGATSTHTKLLEPI